MICARFTSVSCHVVKEGVCEIYECDWTGGCALEQYSLELSRIVTRCTLILLVYCIFELCAELSHAARAVLSEGHAAGAVLSEGHAAGAVLSEGHANLGAVCITDMHFTSVIFFVTSKYVC